jgi:C4-dicarboxylate transporter/malic acid transport protein
MTLQKPQGDLEQPRPAGGVRRPAGVGIEAAGPGWFTSVMGTGILAVCLMISPLPIPFGRALSLTLWSADTALFALLVALWVSAGLRFPGAVAATLRDPAKAQLWGAPPMAAFTIAVGFLKIGETVLPVHACVVAAQALWTAGVAGSLFSAFFVPYLTFTRYELSVDKALGSWLLPVVPPIVASVPAALLIPTVPVAFRGDLLGFAYALLGTGLILAAIVIVIFYGRLVFHKVPEGPLVPTLWIVVGPLGQSIAGTSALGFAAQSVWPAFGHGLALAGLFYGVLVWGFAMYWLAMAIAVTARAVRKRLRFTLGWWAFTFPVGVLTAGTDALFAQTGAHLFGVASVLLLALLAAMWLLVAVTSLRAALGARVTGFQQAHLA